MMYKFRFLYLGLVFDYNLTLCKATDVVHLSSAAVGTNLTYMATDFPLRSGC